MPLARANGYVVQGAGKGGQRKKKGSTELIRVHRFYVDKCPATRLRERRGVGDAEDSARVGVAVREVVQVAAVEEDLR